MKRQEIINLLLSNSNHSSKLEELLRQFGALDNNNMLYENIVNAYSDSSSSHENAKLAIAHLLELMFNKQTELTKKQDGILMSRIFRINKELLDQRCKKCLIAAGFNDLKSIYGYITVYGIEEFEDLLGVGSYSVLVTYQLKILFATYDLKLEKI